MADILFLGAGIEAAITSTEGIEASSSASGFADDNLLDRNKNTLWKSGGTGIGTIKIDLGVARPVSAVGIINGNPKTGGNHGDDSWEYMKIYSDTQWTFATEAQRLYATPTIADEPLWYEDFTEVTVRYWKIYVQNCLVNVTQIGTILLGVPMVFELPYNRPITKGKQAGLDIRETKGGKRYTNKRYGGRRLWTPVNFSILTQAQWDDLVTYLWDASSEGLYPVLFRDTDGSLHWVRVNKGGALFWTHNVHNIWDTPLTIETEL